MLPCYYLYHVKQSPWYCAKWVWSSPFVDGDTIQARFNDLPWSWGQQAVEPGFIPMSIWLQNQLFLSMNCAASLPPTHTHTLQREYTSQGVLGELILPDILHPKSLFPPQLSWFPPCLWSGMSTPASGCHNKAVLHSVSWQASAQAPEGTLLGDQEDTEHQAWGHGPGLPWGEWICCGGKYPYPLKHRWELLEWFSSVQMQIQW